LLRAGGACLAVGAVCAVPFWADAVHYVACPEARISYGWIGEGGRYAFVVCQRRTRSAGWPRPLPYLIVDLRDGSTRELAADDDTWFGGLGGGHAPQRYISYRRQVLDARTGEPAFPTQEERRDAIRATAPWRLPDGRRMWSFDNRLEVDAADGGIDVLDGSWGYANPRGNGFDINRRFYDATRGRYYDRRDLGIYHPDRVWIRAGRWLVRRSEKHPYELLDPDTRTFSPVVGLEPGDCVHTLLDDGRALIGRNGGSLVDPETGRTAPTPSGLIGYESTRTPDGRRVFLRSQRGWSALARFDPATDTFATTAWVACERYTFLLACPTDDTAIVHDGRALYRLHFGSDAKEEIWRLR